MFRLLADVGRFQDYIGETVMTKRTERKSFVKKNGIENDGFDIDKEWNKYCFLCGSELSKKQWKMLADCDKFYTYVEWKQYIRDKYESCPVEGLKEFDRFLNQCQRNVIPGRESASIVISAMIAMAFNFLLNVITEMISPEKFASEVSYIITQSIVIFVFMIWGIKSILLSVKDIFSERNLRTDFFADLREIIDELIREKSKE